MAKVGNYLRALDVCPTPWDQGEEGGEGREEWEDLNYVSGVRMVLGNLRTFANG